jgi:hypothetical protein
MVLIAATAVLIVVLAWAVSAFDRTGIAFAFVVVWAPMTWLGTISRVVTPRLPDRWHELHGFELDGRLYERFGVRIVKRLLRRGPLAAFNPRLHLPDDPTPHRLAQLEQRMRDAEASHAILLIVTLGAAAVSAAEHRWMTAAWILLFDVLLNGYPVMLQRYNRALLRRRFDDDGETHRSQETGG